MKTIRKLAGLPFRGAQYFGLGLMLIGFAGATIADSIASTIEGRQKK